MNRSFLRILCKIALVYVMESRIINKYLTRYVDVKKSLQRNEGGIAK